MNARLLVVAFVVGCAGASLGRDYDESIARCNDGPKRADCSYVVQCPRTKLSVGRFKVADRPLVMDIDGVQCRHLATLEDESSLWCCS